MPCLQVPPLPFVLPTLPPGVTIPVFPGFPVPSPNINLCCQIQFQMPPIPAIGLPIAFPAAVMTTLNGYLKVVQQYMDIYNALGVKCPFE